MRVLRVPFEWLGIGLGMLVFSWLPRRAMLGVCDLISQVMYRFDRASFSITPVGKPIPCWKPLCFKFRPQDVAAAGKSRVE
jgi:hypothetical protein